MPSPTVLAERQIHWLPPVATPAALPAVGRPGEVREVLNDGDGRPAHYAWSTATNTWIKISDPDFVLGGGGGVGWEDAGTVVRLLTSTDNVAVGAAGMIGTEKVLVNGDHRVTGSVLPGADDTGNLGTDALRWNRVRTNNLVTGDLGLQAVDGSADWTIKEMPDCIVAKNNVTGRTYRLCMVDYSDVE